MTLTRPPKRRKGITAGATVLIPQMQGVSQAAQVRQRAQTEARGTIETILRRLIGSKDGNTAGIEDHCGRRWPPISRLTGPILQEQPVFTLATQISEYSSISDVALCSAIRAQVAQIEM